MFESPLFVVILAVIAAVTMIPAILLGNVIVGAITYGCLAVPYILISGYLK